MVDNAKSGQTLTTRQAYKAAAMSFLAPRFKGSNDYEQMAKEAGAIADAFTAEDKEAGNSEKVDYSKLT